MNKKYDDSFEAFKREMDAIVPTKKSYKHSKKVIRKGFFRHEVIITEEGWKELGESMENLTLKVAYSMWGYGLYNQKIEKLEDGNYNISWESATSCD